MMLANNTTIRQLVLALCAFGVAALSLSASAQETEPPSTAPGQFEAAFSASGWNPTPEEMDEALDEWLNDFVTYIITDEEREIFENLPTAEQKLAFVERFWDIRDPTPGTRANEYRRQHMERWATANRRFSAGRPGWLTDRGRMFIILGPPNNLQRNPMGRDGSERASEVWSYNMADNPLLPPVLDLNFVDFKGTGDFELVTNLDDAAQVVSKQFGYVNNPLDVYSLRRHASNVYDERFMQYRMTDPTSVAQEFLDFQQNLREVLRIPEIHKDRLANLQSVYVDAQVDFGEFPFSRTTQFYQAVGEATAVQTTVALEYDKLQGNLFGLKNHYSADIMVALQKDGEIVAQNEKRLNFALTTEELQALQGTQILQTFQLLVPAGDYDMIVVARDNSADRIGRVFEPVAVPDLTGTDLRVSTLTLASRIEQIEARLGDEPRDFQHGDMRVVPNVSRIYYADQPLLIYVQAYGMGLDTESNTNSIVLRGRITSRDGQVREIPAQYPYPSPYSRQSFSLGMPLSGYRPGVYEVELFVEDRVAGTQIRTAAEFAVVGPAAGTGGR